VPEHEAYEEDEAGDASEHPGRIGSVAHLLNLFLSPLQWPAKQ
jgi:hypothetical protein